MSGLPDPERRALEHRRDHVQRDLEELAEQVAAGEIDAESAERLEAGYRAELARFEAAIAALPPEKKRTAAVAAPAGAKARKSRPPAGQRKAGSPTASPEDGSSAPPRFPVKPMIGLGAAVVVLTALIWIIGMGGDDEPAPAATAPAATAAGDGSQLAPSDQLAEMEAAVAANPEVNGMRLALAGIYFDQGDYLPAMEHYLAVLDNDPAPDEESLSLARVGWMAYLTGQPNTARDYLHAAVQLDPEYGEAKLFYGVVLLYGIGDAEAALPVLEEVLQLPDLPATLRPDIENMVEEARAGGGGQ